MPFLYLICLVLHDWGLYPCRSVFLSGRDWQTEGRRGRVVVCVKPEERKRRGAEQKLVFNLPFLFSLSLSVVFGCSFIFSAPCNHGILLALIQVRLVAGDNSLPLTPPQHTHIHYVSSSPPHICLSPPLTPLSWIVFSLKRKKGKKNGWQVSFVLKARLSLCLFLVFSVFHPHFP